MQCCGSHLKEPEKSVKGCSTRLDRGGTVVVVDAFFFKRNRVCDVGNHLLFHTQTSTCEAPFVRFLVK